MTTSVLGFFRTQGEQTQRHFRNKKRFGFHFIIDYNFGNRAVEHAEKAVTVLALGVKEGNRLFIGGQEFML